jgi:Cdc6-like AAA superfamily ATPase
MKPTTISIQEKLIELLNSNQAFGIALNGKWGVGKTFFWNRLIEEKISDKKTAYISLFGVENIFDIERKIIFQISTKDRFITSAKDKIKDFKTTLGLKDEDTNFGLTGSILNIGLSLFEKKDFENVIVCFDDFERISDKLKLKDVLGLISELKEQKKCTVVLILNKNELKEDDLSKYKDKIVDYDFNYEPTVAESFSLIKDNLKAFKEYSIFKNTKSIT